MVNVFVTSYSPEESATHMSDLLLGRMALESAEVLCGAQWNMLLGWHSPTPSREELPDDPNKLPWYRRSIGQRHHPIVEWAQAHPLHYLWLYRHYIQLCKEYKRRFPDRVMLKCAEQRKQLKRGLKLIVKGTPNSQDVYGPYSLDTKPNGLQTCDGLFSQLEFCRAFSHDFPSSIEKQFNKDGDIRKLYRASMCYKYNWVYTRTHKWTSARVPIWCTAWGRYNVAWRRLCPTQPFTPTFHYLILRYRKEHTLQPDLVN